MVLLFVALSSYFFYNTNDLHIFLSSIQTQATVFTHLIHPTYYGSERAKSEMTLLLTVLHIGTNEFNFLGENLCIHIVACPAATQAQTDCTFVNSESLIDELVYHSCARCYRGTMSLRVWSRATAVRPHTLYFPLRNTGKVYPYLSPVRKCV